MPEMLFKQLESPGRCFTPALHPAVIQISYPAHYLELECPAIGIIMKTHSLDTPSQEISSTSNHVQGKDGRGERI